MGLQTKLLRLGVVTFAAMAALIGSAADARAEADTFGIGNGHSGALSVTTGTEVAPRVVNSYAAVTADIATGANQITIGHVIPTTGGGGPFAAGDLILVWRSTGVAASAAPTGSTARLNLSSAPATTSTTANQNGLVGQYEFARVTGVSGTAGSQTLTLAKPMLKGFTKLVTQVVKVPEYTTVSIAAGSVLGATNWQEVAAPPANADPAAPNPNNPWAGGIVIFLAQGAITNNGIISATGKGFHGGVPGERNIKLSLGCPTEQDGDPTAGGLLNPATFSPKGEGVVHSRYQATVGGRGNVSMAGGGGNCLESGGGGGANLGNGGNGAGAALNLGSGGIGGIGIDYSLLDRLTMGGGGGGGRHEVAPLIGSQTSFGGFGGGVIFIRANTMAGSAANSGELRANGANGENSGLLGLPSGVLGEGSGGGGAGGTVVVRLVGTLDCRSLGSPGGNGGNAGVLGQTLFGAGGGGGGGRVLFQAASIADNCKVNTDPGKGGNPSADPGKGGDKQNPGGGFCFETSPGTPGACADPKPVCDTVTGECKGCQEPFGSGQPGSCTVSNEPVCRPSGDCVPCKSDFDPNKVTPDECQLSGSPYCFVTGSDAGAGQIGSCGKCTSNADCAGPTHPGPICNVVAGNCGTTCVNDSDCKNTEWCAPQDANHGNVCTPKTPNSQPVPGIPPINGECTVPNGNRVCLSAKCEEDDDLCGLHNGTPCGQPNECRSEVCFPQDKLCGLPNGEPCTGNGQCRSDKCQDGVCVGCDSDDDCKLGQVCDKPNNQCVDGCRPGIPPKADGTANAGGCKAGEQCVIADGGDIGKCQPLPDAGAGDGGNNNNNGDAGPVDNFGLIEGGGCSCNTTLSSAASPFAILGAAVGALFIARRRRNSRSTRTQ
jgi:MYXO-CTERM domain-containing protein